MVLETRRAGALGLRLVFLFVVGVAAWWGLRDHAKEIQEALVATPWWGLVLSLVLVMLGLAVTGGLWRRILVTHGAQVPRRGASCVFFVGQLGKYIPGSVWSMGVQARMARVFGVAARTTVSTSLLFLFVHVATGLLVGAGAMPWVDLDVSARVLVGSGVLAVGSVMMLPSVIGWVGRRTAGESVTWRGRESLMALLFMVAVWLCYVAALLPLVQEPSLALIGPLAAAFALGYVAGVAVPVAPAGLGAREIVFLTVLSPTLGVAESAALALLARVVHTAADFAVALVAWRLRHAAQR